jgi:predicted nucleic acid-binding protein
MPTAPYFLDTNVLFYAAIGLAQDENKRVRAAELIGAAEFGTSTQVLQELYTSLTRKTANPLPPSRALAWIERLETQPCVLVDPDLIRTSIVLSERFRINYWDAAILAAAERLEAPIVYTEDLNHDQRYGSVRVVNPFLPTQAA